MTDQELRRLTREDLLDIIYELQQKTQRLEQENETIRKQLADRTVKLENAGSIAEAALALNGENFSTAAELLGRDLCHVHFIDIDLPKNGMCLAPGDGTLPMKDYLKVLSDRGYTGGITPELWGTTYHHCAQQAMEKSLAFLRENSL